MKKAWAKMYLAIDTSGEISGLALIRSGGIAAELSWKCERNHAVELLPHIDDFLKQNRLNNTDIGGVIVARGPGSFNGLRVGLGSAKGIAYGLNVPIVGISILEAAAYQHVGSHLPICAILPAGRSEIALAIFRRQNEWRCITPECLSTISELCENTSQPSLFCGEINSEAESELRRQLGDKAVFCQAPSSRIAALATLGEQRLAAGMTETVAAIQPLYLRRPHISQPKSKGAGASDTTPNVAVIWDIDGTIADTAKLHFHAWHMVFAKHGAELSDDDFRKDFGMRNDLIIRNFLGAGTSEQTIQYISEEKNLAYRNILQQQGVHPMPGACELLEALHTRGIHMAVASSSTHQNIELVLRMLGINHLFQAVASGEDVIHGKPNPEIYHKAAAKLGIEACRCVVIEDAIGGVEGACAAGMHSIGVCANHPKASFRAADIVVDTLSQVSVSDIEKLVQN
ncbi:MAG: tRNA (adenosine(37)-N6)-threonylcarbamoyltransferase complex dimerization subunit type 1 TsaB [Dehalococcoidia bacterium]|nr:tRNA (adenosine(37)-N6)-threonylcarbamoyltransferase complex dimerization subunit type 1 TsaB [Dehalococcoidia bacterium]